MTDEYSELNFLLVENIIKKTVNLILYIFISTKFQN